MEHRHVFITVADGTRLAAQLWLPDAQPAPVLLEALPYRMDDLTATYAAEYERLCEEGGFAVCRLDIRGTGSSSGIADRRVHGRGARRHLPGDRLARRHRSGRTGGSACTARRGRGSIHSRSRACVRRLLRAIAPIYASDDRYTDDVHYMGGAVKALDLIDWPHLHGRLERAPPVPAVFGEGWREEWERRIDGVEPWLLRWFEQQADGPYWRHGSVRPDYAEDHLPDDDRRRLGRRVHEYRLPWLRGAHVPEARHPRPLGPRSTATARPGPHIDLVPELIRWFRHWLADEENGVDSEPPIAVFARRSTRPAPDLAEMRGEWRSEATWPPERLMEHVLRPEGVGLETIQVRGDVGQAAWISCAGGGPLGPPGRSALRRRALAHLRLGSLRGRPRRHGSPASSSPSPRPSPSPTCRCVSATCSRMVPPPSRAERSSTSRTETAARRQSRWSPACRRGSSWSSRRRRGSSQRATGCASPSRAPTGRTPGRRRAVRRSRSSEKRRARPPRSLGAAAAPGPEPAADDGKGHPRARQGNRATPDRLGDRARPARPRDPCRHELWLHLRGPVRSPLEEHYAGTVGVSIDDPAVAWARARPCTASHGPRRMCATEARLDIRSDADAYKVVVELVAEEVGPDAG